MRDKLYIKSRFDNVAIQRVLTDELRQQKTTRLNTLAWIYNGGNIRSEEELQRQLRNVNEELLAFELTGQQNQQTKKLALCRKYELELILEII